MADFYKNFLKCDAAVREEISNQIRNGQEDAFCVIDLSQIRSQRKRWADNLPRVQPFYAVKCNPDIKILEELAKLGDVNFDCASRGEIEAVMSLGVSGDRIIYANPCKPISHLRYAENVGVEMTTFDNCDELVKIAKYHKSAKVVLRLLPDDSSAICQLGQKYGADIGDVRDLIRLAKLLELELIGFSFHVGSGCRDPNAYVDALKLAQKAFGIAREIGFEPDLLDIGGGFPGEKIGEATEGSIVFEKIAELMRPALDELFPPHVRIISEPGRYFVYSSTTLVTNIIARRSLGNSLSFPEIVEEAKLEIEGKASEETEKKIGLTKPFGYMYYVNDGVYGSFNCLMYDHAIVTPHVYSEDPDDLDQRVKNRGLMRCSIWGPTCDGLDRICQSIDLPELEVGDWLFFPNMGAYTSAASSKFNGFEKPSNTYIRGLEEEHCEYFS